MTIVRCKIHDCVYMDGGKCIARSIEIDPVKGCLIYMQISGTNLETHYQDDDVEIIGRRQKTWGIISDGLNEDYLE